MHDTTFSKPLRGMMLAPAAAIFAAFWLLPMAALVRISAGEGLAGYLAVLHDSIARGRVPADDLLALWQGDWGGDLSRIYDARSY